MLGFRHHPTPMTPPGTRLPPVTESSEGSPTSRFYSSDLDAVDLILESPLTKFPTHHPQPPPTGARARPQRWGATIDPRHRVLGTASVAAITFFFGCGGPLGSEDIVSLGGPLVALLAFTVYPLVYTIPFAYVVSELSSAFPEDGGFTIWLTNAFGPFWGLQIGYWSWVEGVFNGAIYPTYLLDLLTDYAGLAITSTTTQIVLKMALALALSLPMFGSTRVIGLGALGLLGLVFAPLVVYVTWGFAEFDDGSVLGIVRKLDAPSATGGGEDLPTSVEATIFQILNSVFWNYDGIQMASVFGGQVANPARVYSRAIGVTVSLTIATYILPLVATLVSSSLEWTAFTHGSYVLAASNLGGRGLKGLMILSTIGSNVGLFMSSMFCKSFAVAGMADVKLLPAPFAARNQLFGSPHYAVLVTMLFTIPLSAMDTEKLVPVTNVFSSLVALLIFISAVQLRITLPYIPRPTKVPGGLTSLVAISTIPMSVCLYLTVRNVGNFDEAMLVIAFLFPGLLYGGYQTWRRNRRL